jgi:hypothetical protein
VTRLSRRLGEIDLWEVDLDAELDAELDGEEPPSRRVRPYAMVGGRTRTDERARTPVEAIVETVDVVRATLLTLEPRDIAQLCDSPSSVAEISARLRLPLGVVRVLVADLAAAGHLRVLRPQHSIAKDPAMIERVIRGLSAIS